MDEAPVTKENLTRLTGNAKSKQGSHSTVSLSERTAGTMHTLVINSMISVSGEPPRLPQDKRKSPLSVATTSINFRGFVKKSGPLFAIQDAIESTFMWDDWLWTCVCMAAYAIVMLHPRLLFCVAPATMVIILCNTYFVRYPLTQAAAEASPGDALRASFPNKVLEQEPPCPPLEARPVREGELKFFVHLREVQNMMRLIIDSYDAIAPLVKHVNWSDIPSTLRLLQLSIFATVAMFFIGPLLPLHWMIVLGGEALFIAHHPWVKPTVDGIVAHMSSGKRARQRTLRQRQLKQRIMDVLVEDSLPEYVWQRGWRDMEVFENQRYERTSVYSDNAWSGLALYDEERRPWTRGSDGWSGSDTTEGASPLVSENKDFALDEGWEWIPSDGWRIDFGGRWSTVGVDANGFVFTDNSWQNPAPYAYGLDKNAPVEPSKLLDDDPGSEDDDEGHMDALNLDTLPPRHLAATRRRRWLRRAVRVIEKSNA
ncbi:hypothetical protein MVES1_001028 [Malassezia vespertilionis]|uniref:TECPR1-like DysF domain-containing protein n=1 Tax=Malassezia vespertilionis TaxID=2020962 RepID=A0A2N1JF91_9BASI|nr:uncharacterized protein MVES1_001028 [Malassezia vespertilionis]PKI85186.1 hypothetical protein MVES_000970 [Malassezia vespertilionis]WFD05696.1 hypothetical protein MVES1_001028 [Malassezia vespertilionis]